jgi:HSP20 family protein
MRGGGFAGGLFGSMLGEMLAHPEKMKELMDIEFPFPTKPKVNILEFTDPPRYEVLVELPSVNPATVDVTVLNDTLTLSAERPDPIGEGAFQVVRREWGAEKFERSIKLPSPVEEDEVTAVVTDGILKIILPKPAGPKATRVEVRSG